MLSAVSLPVSFEPVERSISIDTELSETDAAGAAKGERRGVIVMRLTVLESEVHALEIERRTVAAMDAGAESATRPETFRGALVRFDPGEDTVE